MARFRKKPVEVEAVRFVEMMEGSVVEGFKAEGLPAPWISEAYLKPMDEPGSLFSNGNGLMIRTLEGDPVVGCGSGIRTRDPVVMSHVRYRTAPSREAADTAPGRETKEAAGMSAQATGSFAALRARSTPASLRSLSRSTNP
jgi:hypothetical protein